MRKLIWTCKNSGHCGGYADRLKGIVTAYLLAKAVDREFFIEWDGLTNIQEAFDVPCAINAPAGLWGTRFRVIDSLTTTERVRELVQAIASTNEEVVFLSANQYDEPHWRVLDHTTSMSATFSRLLNHLMKPGAALLGHPEYQTAAHFLARHSTVGVQVRTGIFSNEPGVTRIEPKDAWATVLEDPLSQAVFIASDSPKWKDDFAALHPEIPSHQIRFLPSHIERSAPDQIRQTFLRTVIEHQILSECEQVYTGWGGFGRTAAWWGEKPCIDLLAKVSAGSVH